MACKTQKGDAAGGAPQQQHGNKSTYSMGDENKLVLLQAASTAVLQGVSTVKQHLCCYISRARESKAFLTF